MLLEKENHKIVLNSWTVKSKKFDGLKNVLMLSIMSSTMPSIMVVTKDDGEKKSAIYKTYDYTKGRTDIADQRMRF